METMLKDGVAKLNWVRKTKPLGIMLTRPACVLAHDRNHSVQFAETSLLFWDDGGPYFMSQVSGASFFV